MLQRLQALASLQSARIAINAKGRILLIDAADIVAVEAKGNYVLLHHTSSSHTLRECIARMEEKLNPHGFMRIHRSVLVNAVLVEEIQPRICNSLPSRGTGRRVQGPAARPTDN